MPSPVDATIYLTAEGMANRVRVGDFITYVIELENPSDTESIYNISIWDSLPIEVQYYSSNYVTEPTVDSSNGFDFVSWDLGPIILLPGRSTVIKFNVIIRSPANTIINDVWADYNDNAYVPSYAKHPPITCAESAQFPMEPVAVYPNPFSKSGDTIVTFKNVVPNSKICIYTVSGEEVIVIEAHPTRAMAEWDSKNRMSVPVSSGIYYFTVKNRITGKVDVGKIFVVQ